MTVHRAKDHGPSKRQLDRELDFLHILTAHGERMTELVDLTRGLMVNAVLASMTVQIGPEGSFCRSWSVPFAHIFVVNHGATLMTLTSDTPGGSAPTTGPGVHRIPPGGYRGTNMASRTLTLYGNPGDLASIEVNARTQPPSYDSGV